MASHTIFSRNDLLDPRLQALGFDAFGVIGDGVPGVAAGVDDGVLILEHAQAQEAFPEVEPKPFQRIELQP
ncbi:MAG: hypothetical protein R3F54_24795 [Alphaproteobacteria bacterium]